MHQFKIKKPNSASDINLWENMPGGAKFMHSPYSNFHLTHKQIKCMFFNVSLVFSKMYVDT